MNYLLLLVLAMIVLPLPESAEAQLEKVTELQLPAIFRDNMVLQRDLPVPIWGKAPPGESVSINFKSQEKSVIADSHGYWRVNLDPMPASQEPSSLSATAASGRKEFVNVVIGEVWLSSGQSNMQATAKSLNIMDEIQNADNPHIRFFTVPRHGEGNWIPCTTDSARTFSAAGYYFAVTLWKDLQIPVGIINASEGSSSIETWMPPESIVANDFLVDQNGSPLVEEMESFQRFYSNYDRLSVEEKHRVFLKHSTGNYVFARSFLNADGSLKPDVDPSILFHMTVIKPAFYFKKFIVQVQPYAIRGVLWYQGETNALTNGDPQYAQKQKILVEGWRKLWDQGDFPFYFVQIPPCESYALLADFWLQQYEAARNTTNTGMITTVDIGDLKNSHPENKRDIGRRLALLALRDTYGKKEMVASGPIYKSSHINGKTVEVVFDNQGTGLITRDGKSPDWFEVAGADKEFKKAPAVIEGDKIVITSPLEETQYVRFGWSYIATPNLSNKETLPASPFNTAENYFN